MKTERYAVEIEMPDGDMASSTWVCDTLQSESDIEDEGRWKVSIKEYWKPSYEQMEALWGAAENYLEADNVNVRELKGKVLESLYHDLKKLKEE